MPSSKDHSAVTMFNGTALTASIGTPSAGWMTDKIDCRGLKEITLYLDITKGDATLLTLEMQQSNEVRDAADNTDWNDVLSPDADGVLTLEQLTYTIAADIKVAIRINTESISLLRFRAMVDVATSSPAMTATIGAEYGPGQHQSTLNVAGDA